MSTNPGYKGRYELQELLGQGGMAEIWKAFDTQTRQYVAIKFLHANLRADPDFASRFQHEAQIIASLRHPNIVQCHDFFISQPPGTSNITASVVMDYVDGATLNDYIRNTARQGKFLPVSDIIRLFTSIGAALDYAHQHGVVHGQLKPTAILLDRRNTAYNLMGEPIVADFGMARLLATTGGNASGQWLGTPLYTSPEQIMGAPGDARGDVYSLGIILYEVSTGTPPFAGNNPATIMMQHINTIPASPALINPHLPPALVAIITRSIAKDPALRFPSVSSMMVELAQAEEQVELPGVNIPVSVHASQADEAVGANLPTMLLTEHSTYLTPQPGVTPSVALPTSSGFGFSLLPGYAPISSPGLVGTSLSSTARVSSGPVTPMPETFSSGQIFSTGASVLVPPVLLPPQVPPPHTTRRRHVLPIALSVLLALLVIGAGLGVYLGTRQASTTSVGSIAPIVGHAYFVSSGLLSANADTATVQGITDELQIKLENVPLPSLGKSYYGWLLNAKNLEWLPISLGILTVTNGTLISAYPGDAQHSDLLATNSRFAITEESAGLQPTNPSLNPADLVFYAAFSEIKHPFGTEQFSLYDHIRHLLANDPNVQAVGLTGGLDIWLYRNTEKVLEWAGSARDADLPTTRNLQLVQRQLTRIIDYLDGISYTQLQNDLPGQPVLVDTTIARIGLLTFDPVNQKPPGYLYHIEKHLHEIEALPESSSTQKMLTLQIEQGINAINAWDETIRTDALTLSHMSPAQLTGSGALSLLNEVATLANNALVGQVGPQGQVTDGVIQVHYAIQSLATFDVYACTASNPCPTLT